MVVPDSALTETAAAGASEPLFESAEAALRFAFCFCDQQFAKSPDLNQSPIGTGKGLIGFDGAAQAGMINREAWELPPEQYAALFARFGHQISDCPRCGGAVQTDQWLGTCRFLAQFYRPQVAAEAHIQLMVLLVERHFMRRKLTLAEVADRFGDGESKVKHISAELVPVLRAVETRAIRTISDRLICLGIVRAPQTTQVA